MKAKSGKQYTVRGVPREVDQILRKKATQQNVSLNQLLLSELAKAAGKGAAVKRRDLSDLSGIWKPDKEFDRILEEQRRIDPDMWR